MRALQSHGGELRGDDGSRGLSEGEGSKRYEWVEVEGGRWKKRECRGDLGHKMDVNMVAEPGCDPRPGNDATGGKKSGKGVGQWPRDQQHVTTLWVDHSLQRPCCHRAC